MSIDNPRVTVNSTRDDPMSNTEQFLWTEKYRPQTIDQCVIPQYLKDTFQEYVAKGQIPHMILSGGPGVGKTTVAKALCNELECDFIVINGSSENGIDVLRTKITAFATSVSLNGKPKVVIIDEADGLNPNSIQPALRNFLEEYSKNCRFIFTCNYANKIISPLHSRCTVIEFKLTKEDRPAMASRFLKRLVGILEEEGIEADKKVIAQVLTKHFPDYRRILNELQRYSSKGSIDEGILATVQDSDIRDLIASLKAKDFRSMRQWVANNADNDVQRIFRQVFDALIDLVNEVPQMVLIIADYNYKAYFVADQTINSTACFTELMASVTFK
jgi:DNA polymerase III delta prime subunit